MSFCSKCGNQLSERAVFCGECGEKVLNDQVLGTIKYVLTANEKEGVLKQALCYIVFCEEEIIFAHFSKDRQKEAFKLNKEALKNSGAGLIGKISSNVNFFNNYGEKYYQMSRDLILNEESLNFSIKYHDIKKIKFSRVDMIHYEDRIKESVGKLTITFANKKLKFTHKSDDSKKHIKKIFKEKCARVSSYS